MAAQVIRTESAQLGGAAEVRLCPVRVACSGRGRSDESSGQGAAWIYRILVTVFAAAVVVEFFLAGLGIFGAIPGEDESVPHETFEDNFGAHAELGWYLVLGSLLLLIVILVASTGPRSIGATFALAVLTFVQMILGATGEEDSPVAGAFHAINALLVLGLSWFLTLRAWRGNLLIPPSELRRTTPPPPRIC